MAEGMNVWMHGAGSELDGLLNGAYIPGPTLTWPGCELADIVAQIKLASAPTSGSVKIYALVTTTGGVTADGSASVVPQDATLVAELIIRATDTTQKLAAYHCDFPVATTVKLLVLNSTGVAFAASGSTIELLGHVRAA